MTSCDESIRIQDLLDGELSPAEAAAFHAHLAGCADCAAEMASYQRVFATLERAPLPTPRPELTGRILARVLPSLVRRRRIVALGWTYAAALAMCAGLVALWRVAPWSHRYVTAIPAGVSRGLLGAGLFVLNALGASVVHLADGLRWMRVAGERLAPVSRVLEAVLGQPGIVLTVWAAAATCVALLWWMRPRPTPAAREVRHVSILGI